MEINLINPAQVSATFDHSPTLGGWYFDVFYLLAFTFLTCWLLFEVKKRAYPWVSWLLILTASRLAFIVGTKLITFNLSDWLYLLQNLAFPPAQGKVILGGLILGLLTFIGLVRLFRLDWGSLDTLAIVVPLSIAIQRMGCLLAGCCFGTPTEMPWGVTYSAGNLPHYHHFMQGWVESGPSLSIHPFPIYEALNGLTVALLVWLFRSKLRSKGNLLLLSLGLWAIIRGGIEAFRDPASHAFGGEIFWGIKLMQWLLVGFGILFLGVLVLRELALKKKINQRPIQEPSTILIASVLLSTVILTWIGRSWLSPTELLVMNLLLFPCMGVCGYYLFQKHTQAQMRWALLCLTFIPVFLMSQTWKEVSANDSIAPQSYDFVKIGYGGGNFYNYGKYLTSGSPDGCSSNLRYQNFEYSYWNTGLGVGRVKQKKDNWLTYGANLGYGKFTESMVDSTIVNSFQSFNVQPYVLWESEWFATGVGMHFGKFHWSDVSTKNEQTSPYFTSITNKAGIYPSAYARIGKERILFVDYQFSNVFPSPFPGLRSQFGIGSGFGLPRGNYLKFGVNNLGEFLEIKASPNEKIQFNGMYSWRTNQLPGMMEQTKNSQFLLSIQYQFNHRGRD